MEGWKLTRFGKRDDLGGSRVEIVHLLFRFLTLVFAIASIGRSDPRVVVFRRAVDSLIEIPIGVFVGTVKELCGVHVLAIVPRSIGRWITRGLSLGSV